MPTDAPTTAALLGVIATLQAELAAQREQLKEAAETAAAERETRS